MDEDDLPPRKGPPEEPTGAESLGELFGASLWIFVFLAFAGVLLYAATRLFD